jgi:hypothetical protein
MKVRLDRWTSAAERGMMRTVTYARDALHAQHNDPGTADFGQPDEWFAYPNGTVLRGDRIVVESTAQPQIVTRSQATVDEFLALDQSPDSALLAYTRRWGVFGLCGHDLLLGHGLIWARCALVKAPFVEVPRDCPPSTGEAVRVWRYWVHQAAAINWSLRALRRSRAPDIAYLAVLGETAPWVDTIGGFDPFDYPRGVTPDDLGSDPLVGSRTLVAEALDSWLRLAGTGPSLRWGDALPDVRIATDGLLGAIGLGLLDMASEPLGQVRCGACDLYHFPPRPNGALRRYSYCDVCRASRKARNESARHSRERRALDPDWRASEAARATANRR